MILVPLSAIPTRCGRRGWRCRPGSRGHLGRCWMSRVKNPRRSRLARSLAGGAWRRGSALAAELCAHVREVAAAFEPYLAAAVGTSAGPEPASTPTSTLASTPEQDRVGDESAPTEPEQRRRVLDPVDASEVTDPAGVPTTQDGVPDQTHSQEPCNEPCDAP